LYIDKRLMAHAKPVHLAFIYSITSSVSASVAGIAQAYILSVIISSVFLANASIVQIKPYVYLFGLISVLRAFFSWIGRIKAQYAAGTIMAELRQRLIQSFRRGGPTYTAGQKSGELSAVWMNGVDSLEIYFSEYLPQLITAVVIPITILAFVFPADMLSGFVLLLTAPLIPVFMILIGESAQAATQKQWTVFSRMNAHFLDILQGLRTLKIYGKCPAQSRIIHAISSQYRKLTMRVLRIAFLSALVLELVATLSVAIIAVEVGLRLLYGKMSFQPALFLLILAPDFYQPLRQLGARFHAGMEGLSAAQRVFNILDNPLTQKSLHQGLKQLRLPARIRFDNVSFTYQGVENPALDNISFPVEPEAICAIVGASGSGKSTIANLLCGFLKPSHGQILLAGQPLSETDLNIWREHVSWVPQRPHLFHGSIMDNIHIARPTATSKEVQAATKMAHLHDLIMSLPDQYQTLIGEAGARLSGGEAQRLALSRAFLKNSQFLILDEPTTSLDPETDEQITTAIRLLRKNRTVIMIAHRFDSVVHADQIVVLDNGRIIEIGRHAELIQQDGHYTRLIAAWTGAKR